MKNLIFIVTLLSLSLSLSGCGEDKQSKSNICAENNKSINCTNDKKDKKNDVFFNEGIPTSQNSSSLN